jgi:very-short-patch-repair endonuclease
LGKLGEKFEDWAMARSRALKQSVFCLPYDKTLVDRAKEMRRNPTAAERKLWEGCLAKFPDRVLRQRPIDYFIVDFYCAALKLVIEVDGDVHESA